MAIIANRPCDIATEGMRIRAGRVIVAPGDAHLTCVPIGEHAAGIRLDTAPVPNGNVPSVDPMFATLAAVYRARLLAIVLSGMGRDGVDGAAAVRTAGGTVVVQDEASSVVWGMPGAVAGAGLANAILPPHAIGALDRRQPAAGMSAAAPTAAGPSLSGAASSSATNVLAALLEARTGQQIAANRAWRIDTALRPIIAERGLETIDQLVAHLLDGQDATIGDRVVDAMLNQETSFFRDAGVIEASVAAIGETARGRARIWCAGCATGQEPLSLAMAFADVGGDMAEIIASDVSEAALARARAGRYTQFEIQRGLPIRRMVQWFEEAGGEWVATAALRRHIRFVRHNLVADPAPAGQFDAVFCRNLLFYLTPTLRSRVLDTMARALRPGGLLVLGAGETVIGLTDRFTPSRRYRGFYELVAPAIGAMPMRAAR